MNTLKVPVTSAAIVTLWVFWVDVRSRAIYTCSIHMVYIACTLYHPMCASQVICTALSSSSLWLKHPDLSLSRLRISLRLRQLLTLRYMRHLCMHYIDDPLAPVRVQLCSYWGHGQMFLITIIQQKQKLHLLQPNPFRYGHNHPTSMYKEEVITFVIIIILCLYSLHKIYQISRSGQWSHKQIYGLNAIYAVL